MLQVEEQVATQGGVESLQTVTDWVVWVTQTFEEHRLWFGHGTASAREEAEELVFYVLQVPEIDNRIWQTSLTEAQKDQCRALVDKRVRTRTPLAYLTGCAWFAGLVFEVTPAVLIPRSPFAEWISQRFAPWLAGEPKRILEVGTGSGCMAVACAFAFPTATVDAVDIQAEALTVAARNVARYDVADRVSLKQSDVYAGLDDSATYDLIISNPPYVCQEEYDSLPKEYNHEPQVALLAGLDGLSVVRQILKGAADCLTEKGVLIVEVGYSAPLLEDAFPTVPWVWLECRNGGEGLFVITREELVQYQSIWCGETEYEC